MNPKRSHHSIGVLIIGCSPEVEQARIETKNAPSNLTPSQLARWTEKQKVARLEALMSGQNKIVEPPGSATRKKITE